MTYKRWQNDLQSQDGKAWNDGTGQWKWNQSDDIAVVVGEYMVFRTKIDIPKGSTISSAYFRTEYVVKNGATVPQSFSANVFMEFNAAPYPTVNDVYLGPTGTFPPMPRIRTKVGTTYNLNYTTDTPAADFVHIPITTQLQEIVSRPDYEPGMYHAVILNLTAESGDITVRTRNQAFAAEHPNVRAEYIEPNALTVTDRFDVNMFGNHDFEHNNFGWGSHDAFGTFTANTVFTRSTERSRRGAASMKVGTTATDAAKGFMAYTNFTTGPGRSYVFCGWVYVPSSNPNPFQAQWLYHSASLSVTVKDQWVPFCTPVYHNNHEDRTLWPAVVSNGSSNPAYHFFVDDLAVIESKYMQYPFDDSSTPHRKLEFKKFYAGQEYPSVVRKGPAQISARVNPFIVLDDCNSTTGWAVTSGTGVTFDLFNGGVRVNVPTGNSGVNFTYTPPAALARQKRYLVINGEGSATSTEVTRITTAPGGVYDFPIVQATEPSGSATRRFYDLPSNLGSVNLLSFAAYGPGGSPWSFTIYDIGESDRITAQSNLVTATGWTLKDGLWVRTTRDRQSVTFDDTAAGSGHANAGMTLGDLVATGRTWDTVEAL